VLDWILSVVLGVFAAFALWLVWKEPSLLGGVAAACLAISALLLAPPLWNRDAYQRNLRRALAALLAGIGMFMPLKTHTVTLDMPAPAAEHR
jgi:hypothetical protein